MGFEDFLLANTYTYGYKNTDEDNKMCYKASIALLDAFHTLLKCKESEKKFKKKSKKVKENYLEECLAMELEKITYDDNEFGENDTASSRMNKIVSTCHTKVSREFLDWHRNQDLLYSNENAQKWHESAKNQYFYEIDDDGNMIQVHE